MTLILLDLIDDNPHRNMQRNPIDGNHVNTLIDSITRNNWGENVIVREHPDNPRRYQLAYGHNRLAALRKLHADLPAKFGDSQEFIVKDVTDWGMLCWMIDENESQRKLTPEIVYENITSGIEYLEPIIQAAETVEVFGASLGIPNDGLTTPDSYIQVRNNVLSGEGIGARFLEQMLPGNKSTDIHNINSVVGTHYHTTKVKAKAIKVKAKKLKAKSKRAAAKVADDTNTARALEREAEALEAEAKKLATEAKKLESVASQEHLLMFSSVAKMTAFAEAVKREGVPREKHAALVKELLDSGTGSQNYGRTVKAFWFKASGKHGKVVRANAREAFKAKHKDVPLEEFVDKIPAEIRFLIKQLNAVTPFMDQIENEIIKGAIVTACSDLIESATALRTAINNPQSPEAEVQETKLLG